MNSLSGCLNCLVTEGDIYHFARDKAIAIACEEKWQCQRCPVDRVQAEPLGLEMYRLLYSSILLFKGSEARRA